MGLELGLSTENMHEILSNTQIVFHLAATLRLEANLKDAIEMNTTGTQRVLDLAKKMPNLECFVYSSTAFCCADQDVLQEKVYDCPHSPYDLMRCGEWMDAKTLDLITPNLIHPHPNTYTYSKRLSEILVRDAFDQKMPVLIVRPSIVTPAVSTPLPGWVDSLNGPIGIMVGAGKGVIRSMVCNGSYMAEVIPVDFAINGIITAVWKESMKTERSASIPVYNMTAPEHKRTPWGEVLQMGREIAKEYPFEAGVWYPDGDITTSKAVYMFNSIFFHWIPAYFIDFLMFCFGQKRL